MVMMMIMVVKSYFLYHGEEGGDEDPNDNGDEDYDGDLGDDN